MKEISPQNTTDYQHIQLFKTDDELYFDSEISAPEISTITGKPVSELGKPNPIYANSKTLAWREPFMPEEWDKPSDSIGGLAADFGISMLELPMTAPALVMGTMAGISRGMSTTDAFKQAWEYHLSWLGSGHQKERLMSRAIRDLFMPMYPEGSPAVEAVSALTDLTITAGPAAVFDVTRPGLRKLLQTEPVQKMFGFTKEAADSVGSYIDSAFSKAKSVAEKDIMAELQAAVGQDKAKKIQRLVTSKDASVLQDPVFRDYIGRVYQFDEATDADVAYWGAYRYRPDTSSAQKMEESYKTYIEPINTKRVEGDIDQFNMDLAQRFVPKYDLMGNPIPNMSLRYKWLDLNSPTDVLRWFEQESRITQKQFAAAAANAKTGKNINVVTLQKQSDFLKMRITDDIVVDIDPLQALTINRMLDEIDHNIYTMLQGDTDYLMSMGVDRVRLYKLIGARQTLISGVTGKNYPATRWLTLLDTSAPMGSQTIRKYRFQIAKSRLPETTPVHAEALKQAERFATNVGLSREDLNTIKKAFNIGEDVYGSRAALTSSKADASRGLLGSADDAKIAVRAASTLKDARELSVFLKEAGRENPRTKALDYLFRARVEGALSNPYITVRTVFANATMVARAPIYDFSASVFHLATLNPERAARAGLNGVNRIVGAIEGVGDAFRLLNHDGFFTGRFNQNLKKGHIRREFGERLDALDPDTWKGMFDRGPDGSSNPMFASLMSKEAYQNLSITDRAKFHLAHTAIGTPAVNAIAPSSALQRIDLFFKVISYRSRLRAEAWRRAAAEGGSPSQIRIRFNQIMANPDDHTVAKAWQEGLRNSYQTPLEGDWAKPSQAIDFIPQSRFFWLFRTSSTNAVREFFESTPVIQHLMALNPRSRIREMLEAGGADRDFAIGQLSIGVAALGALLMTPTENFITGSGGLPKAGSARLQYPQYQIRIPGIGLVYYGGNDVARGILGPLVSLKELYLQLRDGDFSDEELFQKAVAGVLNVIGDASLNRFYLTSFINTIGALINSATTGNPDPLLYALGVKDPSIKNFVGAVRFAEQVMDQGLHEEFLAVDRKAQDFIERAKQEAGIAPEGVEPTRKDLFGNPFRKSELSGYYGVRTDVKGMPVYREVNILRPALPDVPERSPIGTFYSPLERQEIRNIVAEGIPDQGVPPLRIAFWMRMQEPDYINLPPDIKRAELEKIVNTHIRYAVRMYGQ